MTDKPEFSRPFPLDTLSTGRREAEIDANEAEREALARRFDLASIEGVSATAGLSRRGDAVTASGRLSAAVTQSCIATGDPVPATVEADFEIEFRPRREIDADEEVELREGELDVTFYDGGAVDLGEAVAETLALNLDPYPRSPAAEEALREAGVKSEEEARAESSPFAVLQGLKDKLTK
jgi:uncharacterized metal-binding protein YceD (DUF177 family)